MFQRRVPDAALDYQYFQFGNGRQKFRGPKPDFADAYIAYLGGSETFGRSVENPFPVLISQRTKLPALNFSRQCGGLDLPISDKLMMTACSNALATVLSVTAASNLSNRLYRVHPRRNDRFIAPSTILRKLYPAVDFTRIHFTRHLLSTLFQADPARFDIILEELKRAWVARMREITRNLDCEVILLWLSSRPPRDILSQVTLNELQHDPVLVDQSMIDAIAPDVSNVVECIVSPVDYGGNALPGPNFHRRAADALVPALEKSLLK